jgi:hypothetical protein
MADMEGVSSNALLHTGRLLVKTEGPLGRRSWVLRHVLVSTACLEWYADAGHTDLIGSVQLEGALVVLPEQAKHPFMFEIDWDGQDYLPLRALSGSEMRDWVMVRPAAAFFAPTRRGRGPPCRLQAPPPAAPAAVADVWGLCPPGGR